MKSNFIILLLIIVSSVSKADWTQTGGLPGGTVQTIFYNNTKTFVGTPYSGVYISYDNGDSFIPRNFNLPELNITSFTAEGINIFAGLQNDGVFRTTNDGLNWISARSGMGSYKVNCLAATSTRIFAGTSDSGIYASSNAGVNWFSVNTGLTSHNVNEITVTNNIIFAACTYGGVFRSTNNGANWEQMLYDPNGIYTSIVSKDSIIFVSGLLVGIQRSTNSGLTWQPLNFITSIVYSLAYDGQKVFAGIGGNSNNLYVSTNNGNNWSPSSNGLPTSSAQVISILINGTYSFTGTSGDRNGLYKSTNNGLNWIFSFYNTNAANVSTFYEMNGRIFVGTVGQGISCTTNNGSNWTNTSDGLEGGQIISIGSCDSVLFTGTYSGTYRSTNFGTNWIESNLGLSDPPRAFISNNGAILGLAYGPYKSTDYGHFWFGAGSGFISGGIGTSFTQLGNYVYATSRYRIFLTPNFGTFWVKLTNNPWYSGSISAMTTSSGNLFVGHQDSGMYISSDSGMTFIKINNGITNIRVQALNANSNKVFAGTQGGVFATTNNGSNWIPINTGLTNLNITSLISNSTYLFAGTNGSGVWKILLSEILTNVNNNPGSLPAVYSLQNFPNPFNPKTIINFEIPSNGKSQTARVKLTVFNSLGDEVMTLLNQNLDAGNYSVTFDGSDYASGIYFYTLETENFKSSKRMALIK